MADPDADHGIVYSDDGFIDITLASFFDVGFREDDTVDSYIDRISSLLAEAIDSQLGIHQWHQTHHPDTTLHHSYAALQSRLPPSSSQDSNTVAATNAYSTSPSVSGNLKGYDQLLNLVLDEAIEFLRDSDDPLKTTDQTRRLGLIVCRGTAVMLVSPTDGTDEIANPFIQPEGA